MTADWYDSNQAYLLAELDRVASCFRTDETGDRLDVPAAPRPGLPDDVPPPALVALARTFDLSDFERDVLLMCIGVELDGRFAALVADASGGVGPTFGLALSRLPDPHWSALSPDGALRRWQLVEVRKPGPLTTTAIEVDERALHHVVGVDYLDARLHGVVPLTDPGDLVPSHELLAERLVAIWNEPAAHAPIVQLCGRTTPDLLAVATRGCAQIGLGLHAVAAQHLPRTSDEIASFARLWERESVFLDSALVIDSTSDAGRTDEVTGAVDRLLAEIRGIVVLASTERTTVPADRTSFATDVGRPTASEQVERWQIELGDLAAEAEEVLPGVTAQFDLSVSAIRAAAAEVRLDMSAAGTDASVGSVLWNVCRTRSRSDMETLARRIEPVATWEDLVISPVGRRTLESMAGRIRHRARVYDDWGFGATSSRGRGVAALFSGPSGTGKTMAAEVLAAELALDLYAIDLSGLVSKYIGETEKNLRKIFETAESSGAILLFDEADALFGRRSEVKDSHDRYANIEVSYLLQRMESYRGIAILTTNLRDALDHAFLRRLTYAIDFVFPDQEMRVSLWSSVFPPDAKVGDISVERLAQAQLSGASIRNVAMAAAFMAAADDQPISMPLLAEAAREEFRKSQRTLTTSELEGWS